MDGDDAQRGRQLSPRRAADRGGDPQSHVPARLRVPARGQLDPQERSGSMADVLAGAPRPVRLPVRFVLRRADQPLPNRSAPRTGATNYDGGYEPLDTLCGP